MIDCDVAIYGSGHGGALLAKALSEEYEVALIDPNDFFEVSSSTVRNLVEPEFAREATIPIEKAIPNAEFIHGRLVELEPKGEGKVITNSGEPLTVKATVVVLATGSRYTTEAIRSTQPSLRESRLRFFEEFAERIRESNNILIAGGGPIGVEFAGELIDKYGTSKNITIVNSKDRLLPTTSKAASHVATHFLDEHGVTILNDVKIDLPTNDDLLTPGTATLSDGAKIPYDVLLPAIGGKPITDYMDAHWSAVLNDRREIKVLPTFQVQGSENIFAFGDIAAVDEPKLAWLVGDQVGVVANNVRQCLSKRSLLRSYTSHKDDVRMAVTLGRNHGVLVLPYIGTISWNWFAKLAKSRSMLVPKFRKELGVH